MSLLATIELINKNRYQTSLDNSRFTLKWQNELDRYVYGSGPKLNKYMFGILNFAPNIRFELWLRSG